MSCSSFCAVKQAFSHVAILLRASILINRGCLASGSFIEAVNNRELTSPSFR